MFLNWGNLKLSRLQPLQAGNWSPHTFIVKVKKHQTRWILFQCNKVRLTFHFTALLFALVYIVFVIFYWFAHTGLSYGPMLNKYIIIVPINLLLTI